MHKITVLRLRICRKSASQRSASVSRWTAGRVRRRRRPARRQSCRQSNLPRARGRWSGKTVNQRSSSAGSPRWSPDGKKIAFTTRGQIWVMDSDGDDKKQITKISTELAALCGLRTAIGSRSLRKFILTATTMNVTRTKMKLPKRAKLKLTLPNVYSSAGTNGT